MRILWELMMISGAISAIVNTFNTSLILLIIVVITSVSILLTRQKIKNYVLSKVLDSISLISNNTSFETTVTKNIKTIKYVQGNQTFKVFLPYSRQIKSVKITATKEDNQETFYIPQGISIKGFTPQKLCFDKITIHLLDEELTFEKNDIISY